jgi:hypothetical protein
MTMMKKRKAHLEPDEVLRVAVAAILNGVDHATIAEVLGIANPGRITEAVLVMEWAAENHKMLYRYLKARRRKQRQERNGEAKPEPEPEPANPLLDQEMKLLGTSH